MHASKAAALTNVMAASMAAAPDSSLVSDMREQQVMAQKSEEETRTGVGLRLGLRLASYGTAK